MLAKLQNLGKALLYPIACMPVAALLLRVGVFAGSFHNTGADHATNLQAIFGNIISAPGGAFFNNLGLFFAIGIAFGLTKDSRGEAALVGALSLLGLQGLLAEHALPSLFYSHVMVGALESNGHYVIDPSDTNHIRHLFLSKLLYTTTGGIVDGKDALVASWNIIPGVLGGIGCGFITAALYNRYKEIELPTALGFFSGRRFIPMIVTGATMVFGILAALILPWISYVFDEFGGWVVHQSAAAKGKSGFVNSMTVGALAGIYGVLNRLLLPFGLHHIVNTIFWFQIPLDGMSVIPGKGEVNAFGDISAFANGIRGAGVFQTGYFPIMMFGLPAAAIAMVYCSDIENRQATMGILGSAALVSFFTGITEPIEFSFVFLAPVLYGIHVIFTGIISMLFVAMGVRIGFGFSAGLFDYLISLPTSWDYFKDAHSIWANPLWLWPIGAATAALYYFTFRTFILKFNLSTPGRNSNIISDPTEKPEDHLGYNEDTINEKPEKPAVVDKKAKYKLLATKLLPLLGGNKNIVSVGNCATRLRLNVLDSSIIKKDAIKKLQVFGVITPSKKSVQVIIGPKVEFVANALKDITGK